jgi:hypothetical protein
MFYTPGWGVILTVTGTLGGVAITQAANSAVTWRTTRKERHNLITESVADLIAAGNGWVYAVSTQEQDLHHAIYTGVEEEKLTAKIAELRNNLYVAQLDYGRAYARVRLVCPPSVRQAADDHNDALSAYEEETRRKGSIMLDTRSVHGIETTRPDVVMGPLNELVKATRKATGNKSSA